MLNIAHASLYQPLQFTGLTTVSGSTESSGTIGFSIPFGSAAPSIFEASPGVTFSGGPTFSVAILDTQQFISGILSPIDIKTIGYFLQQRLVLPPPILFHLLFEKIDLVSADGQVVREVENSLADVEKLREFQALITDLIDQAADLRHLAQIEAQGLRMVALDISVEIESTSPRATYRVSSAPEKP